jgi:transposase
MNYNTKYVVRLSQEEREELDALVRRGKVGADRRRRAQILLKADAGAEGSGLADQEVARALDVGVATVHRVWQAYVEEGLQDALCRKLAVRHRPRKLDGEAETRLVAVACSPAPEGRERWTLNLLADKLVELEVVESIAKETVRRTLKKRTQAVAEGTVGDAQGGRCGFRVRDGRCARGLPTTV